MSQNAAAAIWDIKMFRGYMHPDPPRTMVPTYYLSLATPLIVILYILHSGLNRWELHSVRLIFTFVYPTGIA